MAAPTHAAGLSGVYVPRRPVLRVHAHRAGLVLVGGEGNGWEVAQCMIDVERGGPGVTAEQREAIEQREREHWGA